MPARPQSPEAPLESVTPTPCSNGPQEVAEGELDGSASSGVAALKLLSILCSSRTLLGRTSASRVERERRQSEREKRHTAPWWQWNHSSPPPPPPSLPPLLSARLVVKECERRMKSSLLTREQRRVDLVDGDGEWEGRVRHWRRSVWRNQAASW